MGVAASGDDSLEILVSLSHAGEKEERPSTQIDKVSKMDRLKDKCALLMGATGGIGQSCAEMFAREGARVVVTGRRVAHGEAVARRILEAGGDAAFVFCDVTEPESVQEAIRQAMGHLGQLDILLNNAGGSGNADGLVTTASLDEFWNKMRVDHFGTFLALRSAIPEMVKTGGGSVINMVSVAGFGNLGGGRSAYASSKAAVMNLTRSTAHAFASDRIRVNAIAPAGVGTERIKKMLVDRPEAKALVAAQRFGLIEPDDIAYAAVFLASGESRMITGHILPVDAGSFAD
jgi:NAD(P)-dependent dehydrogenase (short-subunit alcohol dehydrogenase family)